MNRMNPHARPSPGANGSMYSILYIYLFSLFTLYIIIKVVSIDLKYIQCSFQCIYNHYPDCTYWIISHSQMSNFQRVVPKYSEETIRDSQ